MIVSGVLSASCRVRACRRLSTSQNRAYCALRCYTSSVTCDNDSNVRMMRRAIAELEKLPAHQLTDEEFLILREHNYRRLPGNRFSLLEFMGLTSQEYAAWVMDGTVPERAMRAEGRRGQAMLYRAGTAGASQPYPATERED